MQRRRFMMSGILGLAVVGLCLSGTGPAEAGPSNKPSHIKPDATPQLVSATRFVVLSDWASEAVLDRETGLVWEKSPAKDSMDWAAAQEHCLNRTAATRKGWRIPSVHELASLVDPSIAPPGPTLRDGHPFTNVQASRYWGAPPNAQYEAPPWFVFFSDGRTKIADQKIGKGLAWCVRNGGLDMVEQQ